MRGELLIWSGLSLVISGSLWLLMDVPKKASKQRVKYNSITEKYREMKRAWVKSKIYKIIGVIVFFVATCGFGWLFWILAKQIDTFTLVLTLATTVWYLGVRKNWLLAVFMGLWALNLERWSVEVGIIWLLTVLGSGFWYKSPSLQKNVILQLLTIMNWVASLDIWLSKHIYNENIINLDTNEKLNWKEIESEGLIECPVCQTVMKFYKIQDGKESVFVDSCSSCKACFFDERDWLLAIQKNFPKSLAPRKKAYICPRCQIPMKANRQYLDPEAAKVYSCQKCLGNLLI